MKKIALDMDGVIFDSEDLYRVYTEIYDVEINKKDTLIDNTKALFQKRYNWTPEQRTDFYSKYAKTVLSTANIMPGFDIVYNKLKDKYNFIILTSRSDEEIDISKNKLDNIIFNDIKIYSGLKNKIEIALKEKVDYIIEDNEDNCINASDNNIKAFYFKNNASNKIEKDNIINVNNWGEIYKYLMLNDK